jgi:hypothetical protein
MFLKCREMASSPSGIGSVWKLLNCIKGQRESNLVVTYIEGNQISSRVRRAMGE